MVEQAKHTPGPWNVCTPVEANTRSWTAEQMMHMWWVGRRPGVAVALVDGSETHSGEADARLIAAAPDLLAELRLAQADVCSLHCPSVGKTGEEWPHSERCEAISATIAKALRKGD